MNICMYFALAVIGVNLLSTAAAQPPTMGHASELVMKSLTPSSKTALTVTSPAFKDGADIPYENTQYRGNIFPGLAWSAGPAGTRSYVVIVQGESLSRARPSTSIHLALFNVPATVTTLPAGMDAPPTGATYGPNVHGLNQPYAGPHTHTAAKNGYHYQVFALDTVLHLEPKVDFDALIVAMTGHLLASGDLVGVSAKDPESKEPDPPSAKPVRVEPGLRSGVRGGDLSTPVTSTADLLSARSSSRRSLPGE